MDNPEVATVTDRARPGLMRMAQVERPRSWHGRMPYRLLSLLVSGALLVTGMAIVYHRINWRDILAVWTSFDPALVAAAAVVYWLQYPVNSFRLVRCP